MPRRAFAILYDMDANRTWEVVANLATRRVDRLQEIPNAQPMVTGEDSGRADQIVRADPRWRRAMEARGIRDLNHVVIVAWTAGYFDLPGTQQGRVVRAIPYYSGGNTRNYYAHPIEGVVAHVNLTTGRSSISWIPIAASRFRANPPNSGRSSTRRCGSLPLRSRSRRSRVPDSASRTAKSDGRSGVSATRCTRARAWCSTPSAMKTRGRVRQVLYRGSLSEMVVPYGDPSGGWFFRNSFDAGELGLGINAVVPQARRGLPGELHRLRRGDGGCRGPPRNDSARDRAIRARRRHRLEARRPGAARSRPGARLRLHGGQLRLRLRLDLPPERQPRNARGADRGDGGEGGGRGVARSLQSSGRQESGGAAPPAFLHVPAGYGCGRAAAQSRGGDE